MQLGFSANMKYVFLISLVVFLKAQCHVLIENPTKSVGLGSVTDMPNIDNLNTTKDPNKVSTVKTVVSDDKRVYLEDVLYRLRHLNWTMEEEPCFNQTLQMLKSLQNFTLWAVWEWDSIASEPSGLLFGNLYQLGNFDECLGAPWVKTHPELQTKYCLTKVRLERTDQTIKRRINEPFDPYSSALDFIQDVPLHSRPLNELTWGACVPASCSPISVKRLLAVMLARSHLGTAGIVPHITVEGECQRSDQTTQFDGLFYAFVVTVLTMIIIAAACTCWNCWKGESSNCSAIKAFCLRENAADLLKIRKDGIEVLYGIRFLSICLIVLDHQFGFVNPVAVSNGRMVDKANMLPAAMLVLHDDLFVDTFFFLSGFLVTINLMVLKRFPNPLFIILKRYIRIVVGFAVVMFFVAAVMPHIGDGPLWPRVAEVESAACRDNWWLGLLMLNNYVNVDNVCLVVSWYIPCDFHYFVLTVLLFWLYRKCPILTKVCAGVIAVGTIVAPGVITYYHDLPAVQLFTYEFLVDPRSSEQFKLSYVKSHTRMASYIIGIIGGWIFTTYKNLDNMQRLNLKCSLAGVSIGLTTMLLIMFSGWLFLFGTHGPVEGALYAALNRPIWAAGLMLLVLSCVFGRIPLVKGFLSWYPWVPLSRLSYGLYLTHSIFILRNVYVTRNPGHYNYMQLVNESVGVIFWGCLAAFAIWLLAEAPSNRLLTVLLRPRAAKVAPKTEGAEGVRSSGNLGFSGTSTQNLAGGEHSGHLCRNMPTTIQFSSKI